MLSEQSSRATVGRLTNDQQSVIGAIKRGRNVVITGPGGTGKTTIINYLKDVMDPDRYHGHDGGSGGPHRRHNPTLIRKDFEDQQT